MITPWGITLLGRRIMFWKTRYERVSTAWTAEIASILWLMGARWTLRHHLWPPSLRFSPKATSASNHPESPTKRTFRASTMNRKRSCPKTLYYRISWQSWHTRIPSLEWVMGARICRTLTIYGSRITWCHLTIIARSASGIRVVPTLTTNSTTPLA